MTAAVYATANEMRSAYLAVRKRLGMAPVAPIMAIKREPQRGMRLYSLPIGPKPLQGWAPPPVMSLHRIAAAVCHVSGVSSADFYSARRFRKACQARQAYYWIARHFTTKSYPQIGKHAADRDHATVMHGVKMVDAHRARFDLVLSLALKHLGIRPLKSGGDGAMP